MKFDGENPEVLRSLQAMQVEPAMQQLQAQITRIKPSGSQLTHRRTEILPQDKYTFDTIENIKEPLRISQQYLDIKKILSSNSNKSEMFTQP